VTETGEGPVGDEIQVCQECGEPLQPEMTDEQPLAKPDGPGGTLTMDTQWHDVCANEDCPRFGKPNDPFETSS
jgi:hypothetical protein